jgi:hypothetical protein
MYSENILGFDWNVPYKYKHKNNFQATIQINKHKKCTYRANAHLIGKEEMNLLNNSRYLLDQQSKKKDPSKRVCYLQIKKFHITVHINNNIQHHHIFTKKLSSNATF